MIEKLPFDVFRILASFTPAPGPSPFGFLYLKPLMASPLQNCLPVTMLMPCGSENVCDDGLPPPTDTVSVPPDTVGLPTIVLVLPFSLPLPMTFRLAGTLGFFTVSELPRIVWSAA